MTDALQAVNLLEAGQLVESLGYFRSLIESNRDDPRRVSNWLLARQYDHELGADDVAQELWAMGALWKQSEKPAAMQARSPQGEGLVCPSERFHKRPLRIGFVSADFHCHTVGRMLQSIHGLQLEQAAALVRDDLLDVLIDLSGHTKGHRHALFAHRLVPVQISWLGFTDTTGLNFIDSVLSDVHHVPQSLAYRFRESLIYLPQARFVFESPDRCPGLVSAIAHGEFGASSQRTVGIAERTEEQLYCTDETSVRFCCFNNLAKISAQTLSMWSKLLAVLPKAQLALRWRSFSDPSVRMLWEARLSDFGIDPCRVRLLNECSYEDFMRSYEGMDIALDTYPFNGAMTSFDAMWMGVPIVSRFGDLPASRQGLCLLSVLGLERFACDSDEAYVDAASELARNLTLRSDLRRTLRQRLACSPLMDATLFAEHWMAAIRQAIDQRLEVSLR
ncbi:MAG: hypothetical protein EBS54_01275 [Betaproteobacteria bacterium]|nr:hypothetical protein [Betaproteobacteria bacterium]